MRSFMYFLRANNGVCARLGSLDWLIGLDFWGLGVEYLLLVDVGDAEMLPTSVLWSANLHGQLCSRA